MTYTNLQKDAAHEIACQLAGIGPAANIKIVSTHPRNIYVLDAGPDLKYRVGLTEITMLRRDAATQRWVTAHTYRTDKLAAMYGARRARAQARARRASGAVR